MKKEKAQPSPLISDAKFKKYESMEDEDILTLITTEPYDDDAAFFLINCRFKRLLRSVFNKVFVYQNYSKELLRSISLDDCLSDLYFHLRGENEPYWGSLRGFSLDAKFSTWLYEVAKHRFSDCRKELLANLHGATLVNPDDLEDKNHPSSAYGKASNKPCAEDFAGADLLDAISQLDESRKLVVLKRLLEDDISSKEISILLQNYWNKIGKKSYNNEGKLVVPDADYVNTLNRKAHNDLKKILIEQFYDDNDMPMTDQLLFAFVEGKATDTERGIVRNYLYKNPQECETVAILMDSTYGVKPQYESFKNDLLINNTPITFSCFKTTSSSFMFTTDFTPSSQKPESFEDRLNNLLTEIINMH